MELKVVVMSKLLNEQAQWLQLELLLIVNK